MIAKKKTKTSKQDLWNKQDVEAAILCAFRDFGKINTKDRNLFRLMNMIFKNLKTLDTPFAQTDLNSNNQTKDLDSQSDEKTKF